MIEINRKAYPFFLITLIYFLLPLIHISLAYTALVCMALPFILLARTGKKVWCSSYCPRSDFLSLFRIISKPLKAPAWLNSDKTRRLFLQFFCINLFFIVMSTYMVYSGNMEAMANVRFLIAFQIPGSLPQLLSDPVLPDWAVHLAYRLYSIMFSSTVVGSLLALFYKPRTWCAVCPVNTLSSAVQRQKKITAGE